MSVLKVFTFAWQLEHTTFKAVATNLEDATAQARAAKPDWVPADTKLVFTGTDQYRGEQHL